MTDSNGVKPSNDDTPDAPAAVVGAPGEIWLTFGDLSEFSGCQVEYADAFRAGDVSWCEEQIETSDVKYIRADLVGQRRQQLASVPAELVQQWYNEWALTVQSGELCKDLAQHIADCTAAAYGCGQPQWVPVSERLPDCGINVLTFAVDYTVDGINIEQRISDGDWSRTYAPTHWMPLPEPPTC